MKLISKIYLGAIVLLSLNACQTAAEIEANEVFDWSGREMAIPKDTSYIKGETYLSLYPQLYTQTKKTMLNFTSTVSIRNISRTDTIYLTAGEYYNTQGDLVTEHIKSPIYVAPLETIEIIINFENDEGGSGANFIFDWVIPNSNAIPLVEGIMVSTLASQGMCFSTVGISTIQ